MCRTGCGEPNADRLCRWRSFAQLRLVGPAADRAAAVRGPDPKRHTQPPVLHPKLRVDLSVICRGAFVA